MLDAILFPADYFNKRNVDKEFQKEYAAVVECGLYREILLFSYDEWVLEGKLVLHRLSESRIKAVYRGWMMNPEQYARFYAELAKKDIDLVTTPEEYQRLHLFPDVYEEIRQDTPRIMLFPQGTNVDLAAVKKMFSRFMVKDYVKSVKGTDFPVFFDESVSPEFFISKMELFYKYRGEMLTGGICIKEFVDLQTYDGRKNEYRVFYINGNVATISRNSGQLNVTSEPPRELIIKYRGLKSRFYTIDFAELTNGDWIIIEVGDGSVSGLSDGQDYCVFFRKLFYAFL